MHKKLAVAFAFFLALSVFIASSSRAIASQEQAPPAQAGSAQGSQPAPSQPAAAAPNTQQPAASSPKTDAPVASAKAGFTDDVKPYLSDRHVAKGMECKSCHGDATPQKPVETAKCLECHKSFDEVAKKTADMSPNPHSNHIVDSQDLDCTSCHHAHKANELYCSQCHADMEMQRNSAAVQPKVSPRLLALLHTGIAR